MDSSTLRQSVLHQSTLLGRAIRWSQLLIIILPGCYLSAAIVSDVLPGLYGLVLMTMFVAYLGGYMAGHSMSIYALALECVYSSIGVGIVLFIAIFGGAAAAGEMAWSLRLPQIFLLQSVPGLCMLHACLNVPSISEIVPGKLYLGNRAIARRPHLLEAFQITHVLEFTGHFRNNPAPNVTCMQLDCGDLPKHLSSKPSIDGVIPQAIDFIEQVMQEPPSSNSKILVHCAAGFSRSPAMVSYWLVVSGQQPDLNSAIKFVTTTRPGVDINPKHIQSIRQVIAAAAAANDNEYKPLSPSTQK